MVSFIKLKESVEEFIAMVLVMLAPIACMGLLLIWLFSLMGFNSISETIRYITYDIIAPCICYSKYSCISYMGSTTYMESTVIFI